MSYKTQPNQLHSFFLEDKVPEISFVLDLHTFESRHPYLECASVEYRDGRKTVEYKDLTGTIKHTIKENKKNGK